LFYKALHFSWWGQASLPAVARSDTFNAEVSLRLTAGIRPLRGHPACPHRYRRKFLTACGIQFLCILWLLIAPVFAQKPLEELPIPDEPIATKAAPKATPSIEDLPIPDEPAQRPPYGGHAQPDESHFEREHTEPKFPAPDGHTVSWFDLWHTYQIGFLRQSLWAGLLVALMCSYLGVYVVLKRIVFVGVALAELSSAGIAVGLWLGLSPILGAILLMLLGVTMFSVRWSPRRVPTESVIGIVYSVAGALAILCVFKSAQGETHMLKLLQGDVLTVSARETWEMLGVFSVVALVHAAFSKEFLLVSFDRDAAATLGYNAARWDFLLYLTIGVVIAFSIRATGILMATTMLILPAVTSLLLAQRMRRVWPVAMLFGALPVVFGLHLSFLIDLPASAVIVALSFLLLLPALAFSARRN
jgi:ABC-type Mn2+/Zn2+ transport system permease subunit